VNNNYYGHRYAHQFQPATPHLQHQPLQLQQPQPHELRSGSGPLVFQDDYNLPGFITRYANAKFFVIKTDNKDHVLSSIRHGLWTSTIPGNQKLNDAYSEAASGERRVQSSTSTFNCPIFLLFSVSVSLDFMSFKSL
jgi:hypothetical protein